MQKTTLVTTHSYEEVPDASEARATEFADFVAFDVGDAGWIVSRDVATLRAWSAFFATLSDNIDRIATSIQMEGS